MEEQEDYWLSIYSIKDFERLNTEQKEKAYLISTSFLQPFGL